MADHLWLPLGLSSRAKALSEAVADLRSSLPAELLATNTVKSKLELFESEIFSLRSAVVPPNSFHASNAIPAIKQLAQRAHETLWDDLPLHAIRNAHKGRAKELTDTDEDGQHTAEIYVAYYKFLQLRNPGLKDDPGPEYREFLHLERFLCAGSGTVPSGNIDGATSAPAPSMSLTTAPVSSSPSRKTTSHPGSKAEKNFMSRLGAMVKH
ncbi:hypothetical protein DFH07DRAFT_789737 [Mycena maculata]|uniref:Uncharacterized protein n=1 Tax=Mycena maculata TaxID=230809 RepID=A0AAD7KF97_9AGAR|nr:hypothetical protein DFH07DRAFT_789737 [Mycena maculata]